MMRGSAIAREVVRNISSGTSRVALLFIIAAAAAGSFVAAEVVSVAHSVADASDYRASGAAVTVLRLPGRVHGGACEALGRVPDVLAAGAMREEGKVRSLTLPGEPLDSYAVTSGFGRVLGASDRGAGAYVSRDVAASFGSETLPLAAPPVKVRGEFDYPPDGRRAGFGWAVVTPTTDLARPFDECWVLTWPQRDDVRQIMLTVATPSAPIGSGEQPSISQLNAKRGESFTGGEDYRSRVTQFAGHILIVFGLVLGIASIWLRRVELASNLHAGAQRRDLRRQHLLEAAAWAAPAAVVATGVGFVLALSWAPAEAVSLCLRTTQLTGSLLLGALIGAVAGVQFMRERDLSRFVKGR